MAQKENPQLQEQLVGFNSQTTAVSILDSGNVCSNCGNKVKPSINKFCEYCGQPLSK